MEKEQIFEMPMPELGSLPPPACARPRQQPHPQCCFNLAPETEGLLSLFPCPQLAISSLPSQLGLFVSSPIPAETSRLEPSLQGTAWLRGLHPVPVLTGVVTWGNPRTPTSP